ncbi:eukaryotic translation initiation factor 2 subunit alpha homolog [Vigna radiata var. radiata]|uniref:Eukaryotic translation initiation factor 2 subunit alpha homolog n=1 Tax=Vigna radiata var. radiata TaxID=3916 RepID=A0A1S3TEZ4_VIGRR|nr:eukaryotic translation initiation factor 2 subunit alpha homolog [Vigna radiata var. radiata]
MIQVGCIELVMVLRVDKEKGYIDLRECRVYEEDIQAYEERYNKSKLVHSIMRQIVEILNIDLENPACYSWNLLLELAFHTYTSGDYDQLGDDLTVELITRVVCQPANWCPAANVN